MADKRRIKGGGYDAGNMGKYKDVMFGETSGSPVKFDKNPPIMGNPAVVGPKMEGNEMREFMSVNQGIEDVFDYSSKYQSNPDMDKESKEYVQSRNYNTGGSVCKGGGKAIRGMNFTGVK